MVERVRINELPDGDLKDELIDLVEDISYYVGERQERTEDDGVRAAFVMACANYVAVREAWTNAPDDSPAELADRPKTAAELRGAYESTLEEMTAEYRDYLSTELQKQISDMDDQESKRKI
jgi:hypothetical protein